jgi:hypothetical protein
MKVTHLRKGLRIKVKQCCDSKMHRDKYGTVMSNSLRGCGRVLIKIDGYDGFFKGNVQLKPTSIKLSDEKPEVGDRIVTLSKPTNWYEIGATGIVRYVGKESLLVNFDGGVYCRTGNDHSWYVGVHRKVGIIRDIEGA